MHVQDACGEPQDFTGEATEAVVFFMANLSLKGRDAIGGKGQTKTVRKEKSYVGNQRLVLAPRIAFVAFLSVTAFAMTGMPVLQRIFLELLKMPCKLSTRMLPELLQWQQ